MKFKHLACLFVICALFLGSGCGSSGNDDSSTTTDDNGNPAGTYLTSADITVNETLSVTDGGTHALDADGSTVSRSNIRINKTGDSSGENADFYGLNAAAIAQNAGTLTLTDSLIVTNGAYANAVFSYGEGSTVNITDSVIITSSNNSGGIMATGGGTLNASNLTITTSAGSSAAIRSDRGGGTITVDGGYYSTSGTGSPAIYSTADITVSNAHLESSTAQGVVIEGSNSVTLNNSTLIANHNKFNGQDSSYQGVMIYQSGSGDANEGKGTFSITGGSITNSNGAVFFITNTAADITLNNSDITNNDDKGVLMRAASAAWGSDGSNGGKVNFYAVNQTLNGDFTVDDDSVLNLYVSADSVFTGAVNTADSEGQIYVELASSTWILTADSYVDALTCEAGDINLNGYKLYVGGSEYEAGTASTGTAVTITTGTNGGGNTHHGGGSR